MKTRNSIRAEINALYKNKVINWLSESVKSKTPSEPVRIYLGAPTRDEDVVAQKDEFINFCDDWHKDLTAGHVDFIEKTYPGIGTIEVPIHLVFDRIDEIATWAGHLVEYHSAEMRLRALERELPDLVDAGVDNINYLTSLDDDDFNRFVAVCKWLCLNKNSHSMIRQIPVRGVDTEWFDSHRLLILNFLRSYLDLNPMRRDVLQLGLLPPPQTVRVIFLDNALRGKTGGIRDLGLTIADLSRLDIRPNKVLFFDDLATALSIPDIPGVVVIVLPSNVSEVCRVPWVAKAQCSYVSGIEMRSFAIINNIRVYLPNTTSVTLNKAVFDADKDLWSFDDIEIQELNSSMALTSDEAMLYNMLAAGMFGRRARLPQERMPLSQIFELLDIDYQEFTPHSDNKRSEVLPKNFLDTASDPEPAPMPAGNFFSSTRSDDFTKIDTAEEELEPEDDNPVISSHKVEDNSSEESVMEDDPIRADIHPEETVAEDVSSDIPDLLQQDKNS